MSRFRVIPNATPTLSAERLYDILRRDTLVLTREAVQQLEARLK